MSATHEIVMRDAQMKADSFAGLSRRYAASGHSWLALHAQVAADLAAADFAAARTQDTAWDRAQVAAEIAALIDETKDSRDVAFDVRAILANALGDAAYDVWGGLVGNLDHLEGFGPADLDAHMDALAQRFSDDTVEVYLGRLDLACAYMPIAVTASDRIARQYDKDVSGFEAWLIRRSLANGDTTLTQYDLLWTLGMEAVASIEELPTSPRQARHVVLSRLVWAVGPQEAGRLLDSLEA